MENKDLQKQFSNLEVLDIIQRMQGQIDLLTDKVNRLENEKPKTNNNTKKPFLVRRRVGKLRNQRHIDSHSSSDGSVSLPKRSTFGVARSREPYQEVLQDNHIFLVSNINLKSSSLLDQLVTNDVITVTDAEAIMSQGQIKDRARSLLLKISSYGEEKFMKFSKCMETDYPFVSEKLNECFRAETKSISALPRFCVYCQIVKNVDIRDVIDELYANRIIGANKSKAITNIRNEVIAWNDIIHCVNKHPNGLTVLCEAVKKKYDHIVTESLPLEQKLLECQCNSTYHGNNAASCLPFRRLKFQESFSSSENSADLNDVQKMTNDAADADDAVEDDNIKDACGRHQIDVDKYLFDIQEEGKTKKGFILSNRKSSSLPSSFRAADDSETYISRKTLNDNETFCTHF